jgi:hypothetical protein
MGHLFEHKRKVVQHRRALQDQRFRPYLKRIYVRFYNAWLWFRKDGYPHITAKINQLKQQITLKLILLKEHIPAEVVVSVAVVIMIMLALLLARAPV